MCVKHGATQPKCRTPGCNKNAKKGGLCISHGAKPKRARCNVDGCMKYAVEGGVCTKHGNSSKQKVPTKKQQSQQKQNAAKGTKKKKGEGGETAKDEAALEVAVQAAIAQEVVAQDPPVDPVLEYV